MAASDCPCGLGKPYEACCGALHRGERAAATAEELMRSRYAAFARGQVDYLVKTLHPAKRAGDEKAQLRRSLKQVRWVGLRVLATEGGTLIDTTGMVEFEAAYVGPGGPGVLRERSRFVREAGYWFYVEGLVGG